MSEITSAICVQGLKFSRDGSEFYGGGRLNFELKFGEILAVLGQNGVGKTTLLNLCLGNLRPRDGKIEILGENVAKMSTKELFNIVSYVPASEKLWA
ncbi:MAG: ATP-binding cassette domain-containing protein [Campylobacter sp.]